MGASKLNRIPTAENFARLNHRNPERTFRSIYSFGRGGPIWGYQIGKKVVSYRIQDRISREAAKRIIDNHGNKTGRPFNHDFVDAFFDYEHEHPIDGVNAFTDLEFQYPIGAKLFIPVRPIAIIKGPAHFEPILVLPWKSMSMSEYQIRLYMTVLEEALFSQRDFRSSPGRVLLFPTSGDEGRKPVIWERGDYALLNKSELYEQISVYLDQLTRAQRRLISEGKP